MSALSGDPILIGQADFKSSATQAHALGTKAVGTGGRVYRYVKAGLATVAGFLYQSPAVVANHVGSRAVAANAAIGATSVSVTIGATAATANQYAEGWLVVTTTPGEGYAYEIASHPAHAGTGDLTVTLKDPLVVALTAAGSKVDLIANPYGAILLTPATTITGAPVGVSHYIIAAGEYGWISTRGPVAASVEGTPIVGSLVSATTDTAGQLVAFTGVLPPVGVMLSAGEDELKKAVFLTLD